MEPHRCPDIVRDIDRFGGPKARNRRQRERTEFGQLLWTELTDGQFRHAEFDDQPGVEGVVGTRRVEWVTTYPQSAVRSTRPSPTNRVSA